MQQEERPFMCPYCQKTFKTNVNCKKHMKTHRGESIPLPSSGQFAASQLVIEAPPAVPQPTFYTATERQPVALAAAGPALLPGAPFLLAQEPAMHQVVASAAPDPGLLALNSPDFGLALSQLQLPAVQDLPLEPTHGPGEEPGRIDRWKCGNCGEEFTELPAMKAHLETHLTQQCPEPEDARHQCTVCSAVFASAAELAGHAETHRPAATEAPDRLGCDQCDATFGSKAAQARHDAVHQERPFRCGHDGCGESYRTVGGLTKHNMAQHEGDPGQFHSPAYRRRPGGHIKLSEEQTKALADTPVELAKTVSEKMLVRSAAEKVKAEQPGEEEPGKETHAHQCDQCEVSFKKPSDLVRHVRTHTGEKPYSCDKCDKRFAVKSTLRTHMKVHTGGKSLECHVCQSLFASRTSLKVHMRLHTGSLPYKCPTCEQRFRTPAHRKTHATNHCGPGKAPARERRTEDMIPLTISAESLTAALEAVSSSGAPLVGATVQLQLHGQGFESALTQLQIDEELLAQLRKGENINISISRTQLDQGSSKRANAGQKAPLATVPEEEEELPPEETDPPEAEGIEEELGPGLEMVTEGREAERALAEEQEQELMPEQVLLLPAPEQLTYSVQTDAEGGILGIEGDKEDTASLLNPLDISQVYICPWCDRVFRTEKDRISHLLSGHGVEVKEDVAPDLVPEEAEAPAGQQSKEKVCSVCEKKFAKPSQLVRHLRVHTGERPFACAVCRKSFNQKNALQIHMKKHTGERPFICPFCQYAFTQKGNLKTHIQRSHAEAAQQLVQKSLKDQEGSGGLLGPRTRRVLAAATLQFLEPPAEKLQ